MTLVNFPVPPYSTSCIFVYVAVIFYAVGVGIKLYYVVAASSDGATDDPESKTKRNHDDHYNHHFTQQGKP